MTNLADGAHGPHVALVSGAKFGRGQQAGRVQTVQTAVDWNLTHRSQVTVTPDLQLGGMGLRTDPANRKRAWTGVQVFNEGWEWNERWDYSCNSHSFIMFLCFLILIKVDLKTTLLCYACMCVLAYSSDIWDQCKHELLTISTSIQLFIFYMRMGIRVLEIWTQKCIKTWTHTNTHFIPPGRVNLNYGCGS